MPRLSVNGSVALPKRIRDELGLNAGDELIVEVRDGEIVMRKPPSILDHKPPLIRKELGLSDRKISDIAWEEHVSEKFGRRPTDS
jgi:AbrB family looped-hinge helix DNA binding protein